MTDRNDKPRVEVRQDSDGRWDWRVLTANGERVASCLKQIGMDERPFARLTAVKRANHAAAAYVRQCAAEWQDVSDD